VLAEEYFHKKFAKYLFFWPTVPSLGAITRSPEAIFRAEGAAHAVHDVLILVIVGPVVELGETFAVRSFG